MTSIFNSLLPSIELDRFLSHFTAGKLRKYNKDSFNALDKHK
jgi:hypothetical protein